MVDVGFAGSSNNADAGNSDSVLSRTEYVIRYASCPLLWCSKLQTEISLSTAGAEYIALSQVMREVIPLMYVLKDIDEIIRLYLPEPKMHC